MKYTHWDEIVENYRNPVIKRLTAEEMAVSSLLNNLRLGNMIIQTDRTISLKNPGVVFYGGRIPEIILKHMQRSLEEK